VKRKAAKPNWHKVSDQFMGENKKIGRRETANKNKKSPKTTLTGLDTLAYSSHGNLKENDSMLSDSRIDGFGGKKNAVHAPILTGTEAQGMRRGLGSLQYPVPVCVRNPNRVSTRDFFFPLRSAQSCEEKAGKRRMKRVQFNDPLHLAHNPLYGR
jgi:hypothetical protein